MDKWAIYFYEEAQDTLASDTMLHRSFTVSKLWLIHGLHILFLKMFEEYIILFGSYT